MAQIDYTQSPDEILLSLINNDNPGKNITLAQIALATPVVVTTGDETEPSFNNRKTKLRASAVANSGYSEYVDVNYNRLHFRDILTTTEASSVKYPLTTEAIDLGENTSLAELIPEINTHYGLNLQPEDFWNTTLPTFEGLPPYADKFVKLEAKPDSKVYIGGVQIKINPNPFDLANMPVTTLSGLIYPSWQARFVNFVSNTVDRGPGNTFW